MQFRIYSGSCLADSLTNSLSESLPSAPEVNHEDGKSSAADEVNWLDSYEFSRFLGQVRSSASGCDSLAPDCNALALESLVCSRLLVNPACTDPIGSAPIDATGLTWNGILMPALLFTKSLLFTLGNAYSAIYTQFICSAIMAHSILKPTHANRAFVLQP